MQLDQNLFATTGPLTLMRGQRSNSHLTQVWQRVIISRPHTREEWHHTLGHCCSWWVVLGEAAVTQRKSSGTEEKQENNSELKTHWCFHSGDTWSVCLFHVGFKIHVPVGVKWIRAAAASGGQHVKHHEAKLTQCECEAVYTHTHTLVCLRNRGMSWWRDEGLKVNMKLNEAKTKGEMWKLL